MKTWEHRELDDGLSEKMHNITDCQLVWISMDQVPGVRRVDSYVFQACLYWLMLG